MTDQSQDIMRARQLLTAVISRTLTPSEVQEAAELIERLSARGDLDAAAWVHTALRRHNKKMKTRATASGSAEKAGLAALLKAKHRLEAETKKLEKQRRRTPPAREGTKE